MGEPEIRDDAVEAQDEDPGWPIGFMIIVALAAFYLGWRLIQLIGRFIGWVF